MWEHDGHATETQVVAARGWIAAYAAHSREWIEFSRQGEVRARIPMRLPEDALGCRFAASDAGRVFLMCSGQDGPLEWNRATGMFESRPELSGFLLGTSPGKMALAQFRLGKETEVRHADVE